ncbi:uncharacterized protein LOC131613501 [Vicia villosa]|uniref:uncharacterized protein LOC131613501 n=1 Tax=Vicia villosa TaxID=3911 RepID=UPI00273B7E37|nr:uncharacterized protein LOC131613501 [Vicia villosa]
MILVGKSGDDIHVVVPAPHVSVFSEKCLLGHTYTVSNFKVVPNVLAFKASGHKYMLKFTAGTSVVDDDKHEIPPKQIVFTSFSDIITGKFVKDVLLDVIGMVDSIGYAQTESGGKKQQINMVLRDHIMPKETRVTLSDQLGSNSQLSSQNSKNSQLTPVQKLLSKVVVLPIVEIIQLKDITFCATVATTKLLAASLFGWYYRACHMCQSIARGDKPPFECEAGQETMAEIISF